MTDIVERLRGRARGYRLGGPKEMAALMDDAADEIERLRAALLTGVLMLSEMGIDPREKCQMAYDYMSAALEGK